MDSYRDLIYSTYATDAWYFEGKHYLVNVAAMRKLYPDCSPADYITKYQALTPNFMQKYSIIYDKYLEVIEEFIPHMLKYYHTRIRISENIATKHLYIIVCFLFEIGAIAYLKMILGDILNDLNKDYTIVWCMQCGKQRNAGCGIGHGRGLYYKPVEYELAKPKPEFTKHMHITNWRSIAEADKKFTDTQCGILQNIMRAAGFPESVVSDIHYYTSYNVTHDTIKRVLSAALSQK